MPKVLFLPWSQSQPSTKYRVHQYLEGLRCHGFETEVFVVSGLTAARRFRMLQKAKTADIVFVQKKLFHPVFLPLLKAANRNIVFDFDDAAFAREPYDPKPRGMSPGSSSSIGRLKAVLKKAKAVVAGNTFLASYAGAYNENVHVLPTPVDTGAQDERVTGDTDSQNVAIGWLGQSKNLYYLEKLRGAFKLVIDQCPSTRLSVISNGRFEPEGLPVENLPWSPETESNWLRSMSIGIMPLEHDDWSRGKCSFKLLQYMAAGLPTVSSPVGMNAEVIQDGVNGLLADTEGEWAEKLLTLIKDPGLRNELGRAGQRTVEERYSLRVCLKQLERILESTLD